MNKNKIVDVVIANGDVVSKGKRYKSSIAINDGTIVALGDKSSLPDAERIVDATGKIVMPGVVDPHVHIDEVPENRAGTYENETQAAALGGVTSIIDFAWQGGDRRIIDNDKTLIDGIQHKIEKGRDSYVDFSVHGVLHRENGKTLDDLSSAIDMGVTSFKMFMSNYPVGVTNGFVHRAFERIAELDAVAAVHTEDPSVCDELTAKMKRQDRSTPDQYPRSRPDYSEAIAAEDAVQMARELGVKYYGVHTSCKKAAEVISSKQEDQSLIRAETCTHYTRLTEDIYDKLGTFPQIAPPIRTETDVDAIFTHLKDGSLSVVSTDHSVYHKEYKEVEQWWDSPFGANSIQTSLPIFHDEAINKRNFTYPKLVELMCTNPADTFGLSKKGSLEPGKDADIVIFDPSKKYTVRSDNNASNSEFSIYEGQEVKGSVDKTFVRGDLVADSGQIVGEPGGGKFIERELPDWSC